MVMTTSTPQRSAIQRSVVAVPARLASSRLPDKVLADIGGQPMIQRVLNRCAEAEGPSSVVLCTDSERLQELVDDFQLERFLHRKGFQLSGGERRRTEVARALAVGPNGPRFLLLDEPFAGVDPLAVSDLQQLISSLRDRGVGMLITDHNVRETLSITDYACILTDGRILASGSADELAADAQVKQYYLGEDFKL